MLPWRAAFHYLRGTLTFSVSSCRCQQQMPLWCAKHVGWCVVPCPIKGLLWDRIHKGCAVCACMSTKGTVYLSCLLLGTRLFVSPTGETLFCSQSGCEGYGAIATRCVGSTHLLTGVGQFV
jgi:hypothetical protein